MKEKIKRFWDILRLLEAVAIIGTMIFVVIQIKDFRNEQSAQLITKMGQVGSITKHNCAVADLGVLLTESGIMPTEFILDPYIENMDFIYNKFGSTTAALITNSLAEMIRVNSYIYTINELNVLGGAETNPQSLERISEKAQERKNWIKEDSEKIKNDFCLRMLRAQGAPLKAYDYNNQ